MQRWIKLHAQVGTATHVIASVEAKESNVGDPVMLAPLLASSVERGFNVRELSADKAYLSNDNLVAIEAVGAVPYGPFKSNNKGTGRSDAWRRLWHMFESQNDQFLAHCSRAGSRRRRHARTASSRCRSRAFSRSGATLRRSHERAALRVITASWDPVST